MQAGHLPGRVHPGEHPEEEGDEQPEEKNPIVQVELPVLDELAV